MTEPRAESACICPRTDGYRIKRRGCPAHAETDAAMWAERDRRKFGTESPHEPSDEFVVQAFAEGARMLWPDSRDPGWHFTFRRWLAAREAQAVAEALDAAASFITTHATFDMAISETRQGWNEACVANADYLNGKASVFRSSPGTSS